MDDYKNNWFYKMCVKRSIVDIILIISGLLLALAGVLILVFVRFISIYNFLLIILGIMMTVKGAGSVFIKLPRMKSRLKELAFDEIEDLGTAPPEKMYYETFYCTEKFLCAPNAYALIRFRNIDNIHVNTVSSSGKQTGMFINVELLNGSPVDINIKGWGTFRNEAEQFLAFLYQKKAEDVY